MPVNFIQPAFSAGELAPAMASRYDLDKFHLGVRLVRNFMVLPPGGLSNRGGTMFVGRCKVSSNDVQLIPFQFNLIQTYVLEFGHRYMRVIMNGGYVLEPAKTITAITRTLPGLITTSVAHGFSKGDQVYITGTGTSLDSTAGRQYVVLTVPTSTTLTLSNLDGSAIDTTNVMPYGGHGGTIARVYTLTTPYNGADVKYLKWTQSNDVLTLCCVNWETQTDYSPYDLSRTQHWVWSLTQINFGATISPPAGLSVTHNAGTDSPAGQQFYYSYVVTAVQDSPPQQSIASSPAAVQANLLDYNTGSENVVSWSAAAGAALYYIYKTNPQTTAIPAGAMYGYIGQTTNTSFTDTQIGPDFSKGPPTHRNPFSGGAGNYPGCCCYFQQRKCFAGSLNSPQTIWMTQPADYDNMDVSNPSQSSDAITLTIAAQQVNAIKHLVPMNDLMIFTSGGIWRILTGYVTQPQPITPTNTVVIPQTWIGAADLPPIVVNYDILYVQSKGSIVRDLAYNFWMNVYTGTDMSVLAQHLFFGHNMVRWTYAEQPWYQVWTVRDDGVLLSFTYLKEQNVYAWAHHDSPGCPGTDKFLSVVSIPEQQVPGVNVDSVYFVVERTIPGINGGKPVKYIERMDSRNMGTLGAADVTKAWFLDCALQYSGNAQNTVSGLDHLNGATVSILADGNVMPPQIVVNGQITLQTNASVVTVGLPYVAQMESLPMMPQGMAMQAVDYRKTLKALSIKVQDTRGVKVGPNFTDMTAIKEWGPAVPMGGPVPLTTGTQRVIVCQQYTVDDTICIQVDQPLPCTILGISPEMSLGDTPG